jgi:outer membrane protein assembly factor BamB
MTGLRPTSPRGTRRAARATLAVWLAASVALPAQAPAGSSWPQYRGNPRLTGVATSTPPPALKLLWKYEAGDVIDSSAAIADGVVYVGAFTGDLLALDLASGKLRWKYATGSQIGESSPAVAGGVVFIGDLDGVVHAVGAQDGKRLWAFKTGQEIRASPVVAGQTLLAGSTDGHLYALEAATGRVRWKFPTDGPVQATPAVADGTVYIAGCDDSLRAVNLADGKELFRIPAGNTGASPAIDGARAYLGTFNNEVLAFDLQAKSLLWRYENPDRQFPFYSSAAIANGRVVVGGRDRLVHAIDAATGKPVWTFTARARVDSSPALAGRLYVLDAATGQKHWEFDTGAGISASPAVADGKVVIGSADGVLYCFG